MVNNGEKVQYEGYTTDLVTDLSLEWLKGRDPDKPFLLMSRSEVRTPLGTTRHHPTPPDNKHITQSKAFIRRINKQNE